VEVLFLQRFQRYDKRNNLLFRITQKDLGLFVDAPESIREDPLFQLLVDDKSIKFPEDAKTNRALENDPYAGATAEGKEIKPKTTKAKAEAKPEVKTETRQDPKPAEKSETTTAK
jgi:hypothetical protein